MLHMGSTLAGFVSHSGCLLDPNSVFKKLDSGDEDGDGEEDPLG